MVSGLPLTLSYRGGGIESEIFVIESYPQLRDDREMAIDAMAGEAFKHNS